MDDVPMSVVPGDKHAEEERKPDPERRGSSYSGPGCGRRWEGSQRPVAGRREGLTHAIDRGNVERWGRPQGRKGRHGAESRVARAPVPRKLVSTSSPRYIYIYAAVELEGGT